MKKFIMAALSLFFFTQCALGFSACNAGKEHEHVFEEEWRHNAQSHWHFCTVTGCNERSSEEAHDDYWELIETTVQPTCFTRGEGKFKCSVCGEIKQDYIEPTEDHEWSDWKPAEEYHYKVCANRGRGCTAEIREDHVPGPEILRSPPGDYTDGVKTVSCTVCNQKLRDIVIPATKIAHTFKLTVSRANDSPFFYYSELDDNWHITVRAPSNADNEYFYNYTLSDGFTANNEPVDVKVYNTVMHVGVSVKMTHMKTNNTVVLLSNPDSPVYNQYASCDSRQFRCRQPGSYKFIFYYSYSAYNGSKEICKVSFVADAYSRNDYNAWLEKWNSESHEGTEITTVLTATPST